LAYLLGRIPRRAGALQSYYERQSLGMVCLTSALMVPNRLI
jgi:hypothetical protein